MEQLLREFLAGSEDLIQALFEDLSALRENRADGGHRRELTGRIFRHLHTLKGGAATAGLTVPSRIAHDMETLLDSIRLGRVSIDEPVLEALDDAAHSLAESLDAAAHGQTTQLPSSVLKNLERLAGNSNASRPSQPATSTVPLPAEIASTLSADETRRLHQAVTEGQSLFVINLSFELESFDRRFRELSDALGQCGEVLSTLPGTSEAAPGAINLRLLYGARADREEVLALVAGHSTATIERLSVPASKELAADASRPEERSASSTEGPKSIAPLATLLRVELSKVDELVSAAHELLMETEAALDLALESAGGEDAARQIERHAAGIHRGFVQLEERLIGLRRLALGRTLERAARAGRQAARAAGKRVAFEIAGGDVRLDQPLVEAIADPLLHLVRNAVAHGIEAPAERLSAGKSERGMVRLEAVAHGDRVLLKISDDGRGINPKSITRAAVSHGIITPGETVSLHQALRLIFRPGFSTVSVVSEVSGRGVGLDVVERAVEGVGGEMRVGSEPGRGMTFELSLPTALALLPSLVITSNGFSYCVDARQVSEAARVEAEKLSRVDEHEWLDWRGVRLPLFRLRELLGQPSPEEDKRSDSLSVVIMSPARGGAEREAVAGKRARLALLVDEWREEPTEVLVRRLGAHAARWSGVGGAAELSDGTLALVLDPLRLIANYRAGR